MTQEIKTTKPKPKKIYFFLPAIADMLLFVKPEGSPRRHVRFYNRTSAICGKPMNGVCTDSKEADEDFLCRSCLRSLRERFTRKYSYRELQPFGITCLIDTTTVSHMYKCLYVYAEHAQKAEELVIAHLHTEISNIENISQIETFTDFSNIRPETITFI